MKCVMKCISRCVLLGHGHLFEIIRFTKISFIFLRFLRLTPFRANMKPSPNTPNSDLILYHLYTTYRPSLLVCFHCWSTGLNTHGIHQTKKCMPTRHRGTGLQLFFISIALTDRPEFNVSKENVLICFNLIINAKSCQTFLPFCKHFTTI